MKYIAYDRNDTPLACLLFGAAAWTIAPRDSSIYWLLQIIVALFEEVQTRKISYCTRSETGQLLRARLLSVSQTCRIQQRNALDFYCAAIHAHRNNHKMPSLRQNL